MRQALRGPGGRSLDQKPRERWEWDQVNTFYLHRIEKHGKHISPVKNSERN